MYRASVSNCGDSKFCAKTLHGEFVIDTEGGGSNPIDTLLASLCGCIGHEVRDVMGRNQIAYSSFVVKAETDLTRDKTRLADISVSLEFDGVNPDEQVRASIMAAAEGCKIRNTLRANSQVDISLVFRNSVHSAA
jgi:uncharacterized OsmC-like protein